MTITVAARAVAAPDCPFRWLVNQLLSTALMVAAFLIAKATRKEVWLVVRRPHRRLKLIELRKPR